MKTVEQDNSILTNINNTINTNIQQTNTTTNDIEDEFL